MLKAIFSLLVVLNLNAFASEEHGHEKHEKHAEHDEHEDHGDHEEHIEGFKLNDASKKTFEIKVVKFNPGKTVITRKAVYKGLNEVNIYRLRAGVFKRIDFKIVSQSKDEMNISSADLTSGDEIVVNGIGFLRMAEIAASGGLADSHSH